MVPHLLRLNISRLSYFVSFYSSVLKQLLMYVYTCVYMHVKTVSGMTQLETALGSHKAVHKEYIAETNNQTRILLAPV